MRVALIVSVALLAGIPAGAFAQMPTPIPYPVVPPSPAPSLFVEKQPAVLATPPRTVFERNKDLLPVLLAALHDKNKLISRNASEALKSLGSGAIPELIEILNGHGTVQTRVDVAILLGNSGPKAEVAMPSLLKILKNTKEPEVLRIAVSKTISLIVGSGPVS